MAVEMQPPNLVPVGAPKRRTPVRSPPPLAHGSKPGLRQVAPGTSHHSAGRGLLPGSPVAPNRATTTIEQARVAGILLPLPRQHAEGRHLHSPCNRRRVRNAGPESNRPVRYGWKQPVYSHGCKCLHLVAEGVAGKPGCRTFGRNSYFRYSSQGCSGTTLYGYARISVREPEDKNLDLQVEQERTRLS